MKVASLFRRWGSGPGIAFIAWLTGAALIAADKSGVTPNTISLPKGPGSIEGLGESFQPTLNTGTAKYGIKLVVPPGPAGHAPALALQYEGGGGNGLLGFGWALPLPQIQRRTDKGIPTYGEEFGLGRPDGFINDLKEELVPDVSGNFHSKNEGVFIRYRQLDEGWEGILPNGTRLEFGRNSEAQVKQGTNIFSWLLERETDTRGNVIEYRYTSFNGESNLNQKYLLEIRYGPRPSPWTAFHFIRFEYEDRPDWFEDCRAGFPIRTGKRLARVVMATQGAALAEHKPGDYNQDGMSDSLLRAYEIAYLRYAGTNSHWSLLESVRPVGADGTSTLPASSFGYAICHPPDVVNAAGKDVLGLAEPPRVMDDSNVDLADLNGDGLADILRTFAAGGQQEAYLNQGQVIIDGIPFLRWTNGTAVAGDSRANSYALSQSTVHLADLDGDGLADLVSQPTAGTIYYFRNQASVSWANRRTMSAQDILPPSPFGSPDVRTADVDFDKQIDIIQSVDASRYFVWLNFGTNQYSARKTQPNTLGALFSSPSVQICDFNGDRVPDIGEVRANSVRVTAGLGYGRFTQVISVAVDVDSIGSLSPAQIQKAKLQDITGDGLTDLVIERAAGNQLWYWINQGNYRFGNRKIITGLPSVGVSTAVRWADLNGDNSTDLVYADGLSTNKLRVIDLGRLLNCGATPNVLTAITNGIGRVTLIGYDSSIIFRLADAAAGKPWTNTMPMVVPVVSAVTNLDSLGHEYVSRFAYHDGYYDSIEKQFRGFARVEQIDVGDVTAPSLVTRSYFDTGREFEAMKGRVLRLTVETEDGRVFSDEETSWAIPPETLATGTNGQLVRFAHPSATSKTIRELGQGQERRLESAVAYDRFGNQTSNANFGLVEGGNRSAFDDERITTTEYAINTNAWILRTPKRSEVKDENRLIIARTEFFYDDETFAGNNLGQVTIGNLTMKREWINPSNAAGYVISMRAKYDPFGNISHALDPLAQAPGGAINLAKGHVRTLAYDPRFHTYPVTETIHVGDGPDPLIFQVTYDEGFGTVNTSTDFNGNQTTFDYDAFARLERIIRPGDTAGYPTTEYDYSLAVPAGSSIVNYVETRLLDRIPGAAQDKRGHYLISRQFIDGLGRKLMTKHEAEPASGSSTPRVVVSEAVLFNARQKASRVINPHFSAGGGTTLDQLLAYEPLETPGWQGQFEEEGTLVSLNLDGAHQSTTTYDAMLRPVSVVNPDGTRSRTVYEPLLTRSYDENDTDAASVHHDTPMVHANDGLGRLIQVEEMTRLNDDGTPAGTLRAWTTSYTYDLNDQLRWIRDSQNNLKEFRYDGLKRKTFMNDPDRGVMTFQYDAASNLTNSLDAKNQRISYTYDGVNRIRTEDYQDQGSLEFSYGRSPDVVYHYDVPVANLDQGDNTLATATNTKGKLAWVEDASGEEHTSCDGRDRVAWTVKRVRDPLHGQLVGYRTGFAYDSVDRLTTLTYPDNDAVSYEYNERGLLKRIPGGPNGSIISNVVYLPSASMRQIDYGNGVQTTYNYDSRLRLKKLRTLSTHIHVELIHFAYDFDPASNIKTIEDRRPGIAVPAGDKRRNTQIFQYDNLYRLTRVQYSFTLPGAAPNNDGEINYRYDRIGNMLAQTSTIDHQEKGLPVADLGLMDSGGVAGRSGRIGRAANDPPGPHALTRIQRNATPDRQYLYDANGNMKTIDGLTNTWDFKDRLVRVENEEMIADYRYDYTDRRITKRVEKKPKSAAGATPAEAFGPPMPASLGKQQLP